MLTAVSAADKEKDAFFVVRKGDVIGIYKDLNDCQAQVGSSVNTSCNLTISCVMFIGWEYKLK